MKIYRKYTILLLIATFTFLYSLLSIIKYDRFLTGLDLGIYVQTMWSYTHLVLPAVTLYPTYGDIAWADHFTPSLTLLSPFYFLIRDPKTLLILQAVLFASGAYPIYKFAKETVKNTLLSLSFSFVYLTSFAAQFPVTFDFHEATFAASFFPWAFYALFKKRWVFLIFLSAIIMGGKEDAPLYVAGIGLYLILTKRNIKLGAVLTVISVLCFYLITHFVMPSFSHNGVKDYALGFSITPSYLIWIFTSPPQKLITMLTAFENNLFLMIFSGPFLLFPFIHFLINFANPNQMGRWGFDMHYRSYLDGIMTFGSILGYEYLMKKRSKFFSVLKIKRICAVLLILNAFLLSYKLHLPLNNLLKPATYQQEQWMKDDNYVISKIPNTGVLLTENFLAPQTAYRQSVYYFPEHLKDADYIVADTRPNQPIINMWPHYQNPNAYVQDILRLIRNKEFTVIAHQGNAYLLKRVNQKL